MPNPSYEWLNDRVAVSCETYGRLCLYHDLLVKWQPQINLVSNDTMAHAWERHFVDSLQLLPIIGKWKDGLTDLGSGAGFPGMVLAAAGVGGVNLVEADTRKCVFLREVARATGAKVSIHNHRIEQNDIGIQRLITARACADLASLLDLSRHYVSHETICLFHKGKNYAKEIEHANATWEYEVEVIPSIVDELSVILKCTHIAKRGNS